MKKQINTISGYSQVQVNVQFYDFSAGKISLEQRSFPGK